MCRDTGNVLYRIMIDEQIKVLCSTIVDCNDDADSRCWLQIA